MPSNVSKLEILSSPEIRTILRSMIDIRHLRYFVAIVEQGSFLKAAEVLRIAQPALSLHVKHMEEEFGVELLHRQARGVIPTDAGTRLLDQAKVVLASFAEITSAVQSQGVPSGEVRIGLPANVTDLLGVRTIEASRQLYPELRVRVAESMSAFLVDWLRDGTVDIAVLYANSAPKGIKLHHIWSEDICVFATPEFAGSSGGDTMTFAQAASLPLVIPGVQHGLRELLDAAAITTGATLAPVIEIDSYRQIKQLVDRGLVYGVLPATSVRSEAQSGTYRCWRLVEPSLQLRACLAYQANRPLSHAASALGELTWNVLRSYVGEGVQGLTLGPDDTSLPRA